MAALAVADPPLPIRSDVRHALLPNASTAIINSPH